MNFDEFAKTDGVGRDVLCDRIRMLVKQVRRLQEDLADDGKMLARVTASNAQLTEHVTAVQTRCTGLLEETRVLRSQLQTLENKEK